MAVLFHHRTLPWRLVALDVPAPDLIRPPGLQPWHRSWRLGWTGPAPTVDLAVGMEHPVEAPLRADVQPTIRQNGHDLARWQRRKFRLVAGQQDPLPLLVREAVRHQAVAAFAAIQSVPITRELPSPTLQRGQPNAQQSGHFSGPCAGCHGSIEDLQGPWAILGRSQSSPSSPQ